MFLQYFIFLFVALFSREWLHASLEDCLPQIMRLAQAEDPGKSSRLALLEAETAQGSLIDFPQGKSQKRIERHNKDLLKALKDPISASSSELVPAISRKDATLLVQTLLNHPTNGQKHEKKYDPEECYGFCFGRATLVHHEALRRKVDPAAIKKIWAVGSLEKGRWQFHVATMVKAKGTGSWWVIDPVYSVAISAEEWIKRMQQGSDDDRMMVFVTDARRFSVYDPQIYTSLDLLGDGKSDFYNGYFRTYLEHTATKPNPTPFNQ